MNASPEQQPERMPPLRAFLELTRDASESYKRHFGILMAIVALRLVPFYVLIWYLPFSDGALQAIFETLILVPAIAALVRFAWASQSGIQVPPMDALLGGSADETLRLLSTNVFIVMLTIVFAAGGPIVFFAFALLLGWATLVTDQVVIVEGSALFQAIRRSYHLVRAARTLTILGIALISLPEFLSIYIYQALEETAIREALIRCITLLFLPFSVMLVTLLYERHLAPTTLQED